jgi:hypothetical protein
MAADGLPPDRFNNGRLPPIPSPPGRDPGELQMEQIRDLLFGELRRQMEGRFAALEARVAALEAGLASARAEEEHRRRAAFDSLAEGITALAGQIRQGKP